MIEQVDNQPSLSATNADESPMQENASSKAKEDINKPRLTEHVEEGNEDESLQVKKRTYAAASAEQKQKALSHTWVFNFESTASLFIALSGFLAAMVTRSIFPDSVIYRWAETCFFVFQLPIFYFGYGYLYQSTWVVNTARSWARSVRRELVLMLVPLSVITFFTLLINSWVGASPTFSFTNLVYAIFIDPVVPAGFFLVSLVLYIFTPTFSSKVQAIVFLVLALILKAFAVAMTSYSETSTLFGALPYLIQNICGAWIWFVGGMALSYMVTRWASV